MPNNILITPASASIQFSGSAANTIRMQVEQSGSVAFYGNSGSLFSIVDNLSGSLMSVTDISGIPILEVFSDDRVVMGSFNRNTLLVSASRVGIRKANPQTELDISGSALITGSLSVSQNLLVGTGSLTTLAIAPASDTNTGVYFPAADTVSVVEGGTEVIRINSSGNVGIGTTSPGSLLHVQGSVSASVFTGSWGNKYTTLIGNGTSTQFTVTHNLNNTSVLVQVVRESSGAFVYPDITLSGSNAVTIGFSTAPSSSEYRANVYGF